jgi:hypothetical protein
MNKKIMCFIYNIMINKRVLFLLILFIGGVYFFQKKSTEGLVVICLFAIYLLFSGGNEHMTGDTEAIQNLASAYQNGTLTATNLNLTGNLTVTGESTMTGTINSTNISNSGNITNTGNLTNTGDFSVTGKSNLTNLNVTGNQTTSGNQSTFGNIYLDPGKSIVFGNAGGMASDGTGTNISLYRRSDGAGFIVTNIANSSVDVSNVIGNNVNWNAFSSGTTQP